VSYNYVDDNTGLYSLTQLLLSPKHEKCREISKEFDVKTVQGHPRSLIFMSMESPHVNSY